MMKKGQNKLMRKKLLLSAAVCAAAGMTFEAAAQVDTITVTARKKTENVQDVPISITAMNGEMLSDLGVEDLADVAKFAPNVSFDGTAAVSGSSIASTVFIRGVGQTDFTLNSDPGVGVYLDGVYIARSVGGLLDLVDVETVEVLRGPQGTLFGKNTIGGAINVKTRRPDPDGGGYIELQGGNFSRANIKAGFDLPITDTLVANVAGAFLTQDGYQERILEPDEPALGDVDRFVIRSRAIWTPTEAFEADLNFDVTRVREESTPQTVLEIVPDTSGVGGAGAPFLAAAAGLIPGTSATVRPEYAGLGFVGANITDGTIINTSEDGTAIDPRRSFYGGPSRSDADIFGAALTLSYRLSSFEVKSISAYREVISDFARDSTSSPFLIADTVDSYDQNQFSQEIQLLGELADGRADFVLGGYFLSEEGENSNLVDTSIGDLGSGGSIDNESLAAFFQTNIHLSDRLTLTGGLRYTDETKRFDPGFRGGEQLFTVDANGSPVLGGAPIGATVPLIVAPESLGLGDFYENSDDKIDRTIALNFAATDTINIYASHSTGFKAGGFSQRIGPGPGIPAPDFRREDVSAYEIGFKSLLMENTLRLNGAVFYSDYDDLQATPIFEGIGPVTRNLGDAEIWGLELEWSYVPNENFEWTGGLGYLNDEVTSLDPVVSTTNIELDGSQILNLDTQLPKTPEFSANSTMAYTMPIDNRRSVTVRGNWAFTSEMFNDVLNSPALIRDDLHLLGASVTLNWGDWVAGFTGVNLTDETYIVSGNDETARDQFGYTQAIYNRPREWWFTLRRDF